jgi:sugar phosphate isomerase/epimerase
MHEQPNRRQFIRYTSLAAACAAVPALTGAAPAVAASAPSASAPPTTTPSAYKKGPIERIGGPSLKLSLNAYSFSKMLNDYNKRNDPAGMSLMDLLVFCAKHNFDGLDATGYFFPGYPDVPKDAFLNEFKRRAFELGIGISGTGVRNNFTTSDKAVRADAIKHIKEWVEVAARMGAPVLRVFADTQMKAQTWQDVAKGCTRDEVQKWITEALVECTDHGRRFGVIIGVQNHGDFLKTGDDLLALINGVNSPWCGAIVDTGYFKTPDPYKDMAQVAPYAVNWQIKQRPFGDDDAAPTDLVKLVRIIRESNYRGYVPIETLSYKNVAYDPLTTVPAFLAQLRQAISGTA